MSCHSQPNVAKAIGHEENELHTLTFEFERELADGQSDTALTAHIELTEKQFNNFFQLREIAIEKKLSAVELYVHGAKWIGDSQNMEFAEFVIHVSSGISLKAFRSGHSGKIVSSQWIQWGTLDLMAVLGDTQDKPMPMGEVERVLIEKSRRIPEEVS